MTEQMGLVLIALSAGVVSCLDVLSYEREGIQRDWTRDTPRNGGWLLPSLVLFLIILYLVDGLAGNWNATLSLFGWMAGFFLQISVYFVLLALALPLLRRYLRAEACAMLWIVPNYLYVTTYTRSWNQPRWIIPLPIKFIGAAAVIWLAGTVAVLAWKIFAHLRFRRWLLRDAEEVTDPEVLAAWQGELLQVGEKESEYILVTSPRVTTPMTIGLFSKSVRVVLPRRHYTPEELKLIFRHELVHIGRRDAWSKFFLVFCTALCWFNPLMWLATGKSAEDLELSCDEAVTASLDAEERRRYADLILRTAGDGRGFTTCLSASASALRYRLKSIVQPVRKHSGALLVGAAATLLVLLSGQVGLAYGGGTGETQIFPEMSGNVTLTQAAWSGEKTQCRDEEGLEHYLSSLTMYQLLEDYGYGTQDEPLFLTYDTPRGTLKVSLWRDYVRVMPSWEETAQRHNYYVSGGLDWEKLDGLFDR